MTEAGTFSCLELILSNICDGKLPAMKLVKNNLEISYYDSGKGSPIVLLHSFGHTKLMWFPQLSYFEKCGFRVIAPDYRGYGESNFDRSRRFTIDSLADDISTLAFELALEKATFVGISMGGYVALSLWEKHPELIGRLVLSNTKAEADTEEIKARRSTQIQFLKEHTLAEFVESSAPKRLSQKTLAQRPWVLDAIKLLNLTVNSEVLIATLQAMIEKRDNTPSLHTINVPTLVTAGGEDIHIPKSSAKTLTDNIKGSKFSMIEGTAHVSNLEDPGQYCQTLDQFFHETG